VSLGASRPVRAAFFCAWLAGCASPAPPIDGWHDVALPGKPRTLYRWHGEGPQRELHASADASASMFRRRVPPGNATPAEIRFSWWVQALPEGADVGVADATDAAARVMLAFDGDTARLSPRNQLMFELARTLSGEAPPYATLVYVWDAKAPVGSVIVHPRSDRVRKIVVESGTAALGQWRSYRRSLADDFRLAFGEPPGPLRAVAVMTDGDNTRSRLSTRYRHIELR
jgi:Protein of unknown function (DUF3047)